jgi:hypothetical protein
MRFVSLSCSETAKASLLARNPSSDLSLSNLFSTDLLTTGFADSASLTFAASVLTLLARRALSFSAAFSRA